MVGGKEHFVRLRDPEQPPATGSRPRHAIEVGQRKFSMWNPSMIPIKVIMVCGIFLMLLQAISMFFKDLAKARGIELK